MYQLSTVLGGWVILNKERRPGGENEAIVNKSGRDELGNDQSLIHDSYPF